MPDVFLSCSREDQVVARHLAEGLEREGFSVWWDQTLRSGEAYGRVTEKALREAKAVTRDPEFGGACLGRATGKSLFGSQLEDVERDAARAMEIQWSPELGNFRRDPRFHELTSRLDNACH